MSARSVSTEGLNQRRIVSSPHSQLTKSNTNKNTIASAEELIKNMGEFFSSIKFDPKVSKKAIFTCNFPHNPGNSLKVEYEYTLENRSVCLPTRKVITQEKEVTCTKKFPTSDKFTLHTGGDGFGLVKVKNLPAFMPRYTIFARISNANTAIDLEQIDIAVCQIMEKFISKTKEYSITIYTQILLSRKRKCEAIGLVVYSSALILFTSWFCGMDINPFD